MPDFDLHVFVPTKSRVDLERGTLNTLAAAGVKATMVVEPAEADAYRAAHPKHEALVLSRNGKGLVFSRNSILEYARKKKLGWFWMLDDDIRDFHENYENKNHRVDARTALQGATTQFAARPDVGQAALEYSQIAWAAKKAFSLNSYCDVAVCIHAQRTKARYDDYVTMKEDRDFTLQVLSAGLLTCRVQRFSFAAPKNGSNKGGLFDEYQAGREAEASRRMVEKWGAEVCALKTKSDGRPDVKINWAYFQPWKRKVG